MIIPVIGYRFHPPLRPSAPGCSQLDMIVKDPSTPVTPSSYDLDQASIWIATPEDLPEMVSLSHPWLYDSQKKVCAGHIVLQLKTGERLVAFTFGGNLEAQSQTDRTIFTLTSPAPILKYAGFDDIPTILANEVDILFAERRARELPNLDDYNRSLVCTDPFLLYCACLNVLKEKFRNLSRPESRSMLDFYSFLTTEVESLKSANLWPKPLPDLADLI